MASNLFVPYHPPRPARNLGVWRSLFGEHARNGVAGWSGLAFEQWYIKRNLLGTIVHVPRHPNMVEHVLLRAASNYRKPGIVRRIFAPFVGEGLFTAEDDLWRTQRKLVAASFAPAAVTALTGLMARDTERHMADWPRSGIVDIARVATETTMQVIADTLFSGDARLTTPQAIRHIEDALISVGSLRVMALLGFPELRMGMKARKGERGRIFLRGTLEALVRERSHGDREDFMSGLIRDLKARFPEEEALRLAVDNAATFYVAGHETTANALSWSIYLLANTPQAQERARAEARNALQGELETLPDGTIPMPLIRIALRPGPRLGDTAFNICPSGQDRGSASELVSR